jgi:diguanylate cyclase (GGDEF)-like protein
VVRVADPAHGPLIVKRGTEDGNADAFGTALRNEWRILQRLRGVDGCARPVRLEPARRELAVEDFGGVTLEQSGLLGRAGLDSFLALSEALARIVDAIHRRGVIHRDLKPANILVRPSESAGDPKVQIIDFDLSTFFTEERPEFGQPGPLPGSPAYLSPEQTGRMNRPVDYRADLYSLGATLYALATGAPPFEETDPLALIHAHLARAPLPPRERAGWLPHAVSGLILALLAKEPDERYQSAAGLAHDLARMRRALAAQLPLDSVPLKTHDLPLSPRPPRCLRGRDRELATLLAAFADARAGGAQGLFVAGYAGVGKTSLIQEIQRPVTLARGWLLNGKFEQFQRDRPFLAPAQSLRQLCQLLLAESEAAAERWRRRILDGVGADAGALFEVVPELEALLGPQAPAPTLGPLEAQVRLRNLLVALLRQAAAPEHPLVLFLDDLQWADPPSLELIGALLEEASLGGLLLIGAYRDNEVDASHPLSRLLRKPTATGRPPTVLTLDSLASSDTAALVADMLHIGQDTAQALAEAVYAKTSGNPFFTVEFLHALHRAGALRPDPMRGRWHWDEAAVSARPASANVVEFLAEGLADLAGPTAEALVAAACLGSGCTLGLLARAAGIEPGVLAERLVPALERGIIVTPAALAFHRADAAAPLRFCHDRMQQAAYLLRDEAWRSRLHLAMARRFAPAGDSPALPFSAAEHYAAAAPLIAEAGERAQARRLFLAAALRARQSGAFATAERFLRLGVALLAAGAWHSDPGAAFALHAELHLALYSQSLHAEADAVYAVLEAHADSPLQMVDPACAQVASLTNRTRYGDAIALVCALLERLGLPVPMDRLPASLEQELDTLYAYVAAGALERLPDSPALADERRLGAAKLMNHARPSAFFSRSLLACWLPLRLARVWIENGFCPDALFPSGCVISSTILLRGDYATGFRVARTALETGLAREQGAETARCRQAFATFNSHWFQPLGENVAQAHAAFDGLVRAGDLQMAGYTFSSAQAALLDTGLHLSELAAETAAALKFNHKAGNRHGVQSYLVYRQLARALAGATLRPGSLDDAEFDEQAHLAALQDNAIALFYFHTYRSVAACLFGDGQALAHHAEQAASLAPSFPGLYPTALANFLHSLSLADRLREADAAARPALLERLAANQDWLAARAADAPMNFGHLHALVEAERLDALGLLGDALQHFEQAMRKAQGNLRPWHHALATERAGLCCMRRGLDHAGRALLARAHELYRQWGANGKARSMRAALPFVDLGRPAGGSSGDSAESLEYDALLRATQALASETSLPRLVASVVALAGQLTGATDVRLLLPDEEGSWHLEGGRRDAKALERMTLAEAKRRRLVAASVSRLGLKMPKPLVSDDAVIDTRFSGDPYFAGLPLCSLLALPILMRGKTGALLVMENRLFRAAFTAERVEGVAMLCKQLAVFIENARLYQSLERKVAERTADLEEANRALQRLSDYDWLTGLPNRRKFDLAWEAEWRRAARQGLPLAVAMLDVDFFKAYNDYYGHPAGDDCLRRVAHILETSLRRSCELIARYGGEEFIAILPGLDAAEACETAERIRLAVEAQAIPHAKGIAAGVVTTSIGVAARTPQPGEDPERLPKEADAALYHAKRQGRNRVVLAA